MRKNGSARDLAELCSPGFGVFETLKHFRTNKSCSAATFGGVEAENQGPVS